MSNSSKLKTISTAAIFFFVACAPSLADDQDDADAMFADQDWAGAAAAYEALLSGDRENASNWFNMGRAKHQLEDYAGAIDAYRKALAAGYQPAPRANFFLARALMSSNEREEALLVLEKIAVSGGPSFRALQAAPEFEPLSDEPRFQAVIAALTPCNTEEYRQFDFWIGEWNVTSAGSPTPTAVNKISRREDGCVVFEEYETVGGFTGMSINFYDAHTEQWHQTWMSNAGSALYIEGGLNDKGEMVLESDGLSQNEGAPSISRVTWTPNEDGSVRQFWQSSTDGGETWTTAFDGLYTPKMD
ncbi:MAG: tetratricopeptide repeat protein [Marinicaulis sp.]|nr:tetratricopeptide repeat protein [Marinicaulis sp.]NNE42177.1 tetratricopeptide repeat protein [Marinicaulis sp.]NNL88016.1 tetratricopeptide repeat protein [Marinicaulis sp.]